MKVHRGLNQRWENVYFWKLYKKTKCPGHWKQRTCSFPSVLTHLPLSWWPLGAGKGWGQGCRCGCSRVLVMLVLNLGWGFISQQFVKLYAVFFLINAIFYNFKGWKSKRRKGRKMEEMGRKQNDKKGVGKGRVWQRKHCIIVSYYHLKTIPNAFGCTFECRNKILIKLSVINTHV